MEGEARVDEAEEGGSREGGVGVHDVGGDENGHLLGDEFLDTMLLGGDYDGGVVGGGFNADEVDEGIEFIGFLEVVD